MFKGYVTAHHWEKETGSSEVQGEFWLGSEFEASLGYARPCLTQRNESQASKQKLPPESDR